MMNVSCLNTRIDVSYWFQLLFCSCCFCFSISCKQTGDLMHLSYLWICVISNAWLAGRLAILHSKNFNVCHHVQTFQPNIFILAMFRGYIDFFLFMPLSVTLTLVGVTSSVHRSNSCLHFLIHFSTDQDEN